MAHQKQTRNTDHMKWILQALALLLTISLNACQDMKKKEEHREALNDSMVLTLPAAAGFSASVDGKDVSLYSLKNREGMQVLLTNYGATVVSITAKDRTKTYGDVLTMGTTEFTSVGLANADVINGVTLVSEGSASTAKVNGSPYSIVVSSAIGTGLSNYNITYLPGKLTIIRKELIDDV